MKPRGWALPMLCLLLLTGAATLAAVVQAHLAQQARSLQGRWESLQAHAAAEGQLRLAMGLLDAAQTVDEGCRVMPIASVGSTVSTDPTAPPGPDFADRLMRHGSTIVCRVSLDAPTGRPAWHCNCRLDGSPADPGDPTPLPGEPPPGADVAQSAAPGRVLTGLQVSALSSGMRLLSRACLIRDDLPSPGIPCTFDHLLLGSAAGATAAVSVRVRRDAQGVWREVAGSWTDAP